jgi:hypothetical protein
MFLPYDPLFQERFFSHFSATCQEKPPSIIRLWAGAEKRDPDMRRHHGIGQMQFGQESILITGG